MKHLGKKLVVLASLVVLHVGCGGGGGSSFTQEEAGEATKTSLGAFIGGSFFAVLDLQGQSGDFDILTDCDGGGTMRFSGTLTVISDTEADISMDAEGANCGSPMGAVDGTLHYEGSIDSFDITGRWTFSGDTLSGSCSFDASATYSADGTRFAVTGTACGQNVAGDYLVSDILPEA